MIEQPIQIVRAHARLSASGAKKWLACTMAPTMEDGIADVDSDASREGTCAHAHGEHRLQRWLGLPLDYPTESDIPEHEEWFDEAFSDYVSEYVAFVKDRVTELRELHGAENVIVLLEQRLDFSRWAPEGFGTGDIVIIVPKRIEVIDLKFGQGVWVDGEDNEQMKLYALGAWDRYDVLYDFDEVTVTIHQPRKNNVGGETISVAALLEWAETIVKPRAAVAHTGIGATFSPGTHCSSAFCKARFTCKARFDHNMAMADEDFAMADPTHLTLDQVERVAARAGEFAKWAKDIEKYLLAQAKTGAVLTLHKLVEGRSNRKISDVAEAERLLVNEGFQKEELYLDPKFLGLGGLEALVGKKKLAEVLKDVLVKPEGALTLAPIESKAEAKKAPASADADFS